MTTRRRFLGQAATVLVAACSSPDQPQAPAPTPTPAPDSIVRGATGESIDEFLTGVVPDGASLTVLAARGGEIVYGKGFGLADREAGSAAGLDTAYDIGSVTKQFTAAGILRLEMAGELATTDPLTRFYDNLPDDKRDITLHHLLTHTAGLVEQLGDDYEATSRDDLLAGAARSALLRSPGTEYRYSNLGYSVLAAVIEQVSGTGYERYLAEQLFGPAGMAQTGYVLPEWNPEQVAMEYDRHGAAQGRPHEHPWDVDGPYWNLRGNGGILSTARDMFRWHLALEGSDVLSEAAKAKLFEPHVLEDNGETHYGYGWVIVSEGDERIAWHNGGNGWSFTDYLRSVDAGGLAVFWATGHVERAGSWQLEDLDLLSEIVNRLRDE
jgi:CubicO group peptidase (beta-lactamase class C family)